MLKFKLPLGMQDYLPDYLYNKLCIEEKIMKTFKGYSYEQIETPKLEAYDIFSSGVGAVPSNKLFKMSDTDGNLLVLRADMTLPISRIVSTKMQPDFPLRLCYLSDSFNLVADRNRSREFSQAGVELYGIRGAEGDAEVIALAIEALLNAGLTDFQIDIGQVGILKGILNETVLSGEMKAQIISSVDKKNIISQGIDEKLAKTINAISMLYGDISVLKEASEIVHNKTSIDALLNLYEIYHILCEYKLENYISFDLGLVNSFSYYSGVVFKGITKHFGSPILGGGRYDTLCRTFDKDICATGFAIGIKDLMQAMKQSGIVPEKNVIDIAIGIADSITALGVAKKIANGIIEKGFKVNILYQTTLEEIKEYAAKKGIETVFYINDKGETEEVEQ